MVLVSKCDVSRVLIGCSAIVTVIYMTLLNLSSVQSDLLNLSSVQSDLLNLSSVQSDIIMGICNCEPDQLS